MRLNVDQQMKSLLTKDEHFWRDLLNVYLVKVSEITYFFQSKLNNSFPHYSQITL